ncbi:hypothetical protein B9T26_09190 [Acinetobacter sp. ANC 4169]|nr:hypothetical protein [Acinetobacter sp. ANC 4169]OTG73251.1 hypothetical protein B9T26_09190 [Acinetobacter sp. ANC 4169]
MKIKMLVLSSIFILLACSQQKNYDQLPPLLLKCNDIDYSSDYCLNQDYNIKPLEPRKKNKDSWFYIFLSGGHPSQYSGPDEQNIIIYALENAVLEMNNHFIDSSGGISRELVFRGNDVIIRNGIVLNVNISLGDSYFSPNFATGEQINNSSVGKNTNSEIIKYGFLYADNLYDCKQGTYVPCNSDQLKILENSQRLKKRENMFIKNIKNKANDLTLQSWGGGIFNSQLILKNRINIYGSKSTIINNKIISNAELKAENSIFPLIQIKKSNLIAHSQQIFPDENDDKTAISTVTYIKFSPNTVIDNNSFTLTQKNDQAYAIVLDHSPRVRITNNTFNGFKVPILMDQWSSIVDEKGNEIKPENFTGYGNVINPDKFSGNVTLNRKGEIVKE